MQCISRHLQLTFVESALCCSCLEPLFSLGSQTACTQCTFSTLPGVIVLGTGSQSSYTASSEQAPIHFTEAVDMNGRFQKQGGKNWFLPNEMNANRFFWDSHWLEIWSNHFYPSMGPNGGSVAMDSAENSMSGTYIEC
jgi:hypothetical protein